MELTVDIARNEYYKIGREIDMLGYVKTWGGVKQLEKLQNRLIVVGEFLVKNDHDASSPLHDVPPSKLGIEMPHCKEAMRDRLRKKLFNRAKP